MNGQCQGRLCGVYLFSIVRDIIAELANRHDLYPMSCSGSLQADEPVRWKRLACRACHQSPSHCYGNNVLTFDPGILQIGAKSGNT